MSRRLRTALVALCLGAVVVIVCLDRARPGRTGREKSQSKERTAANDFEKYHTKTFRIAKVVDGDTIDIDIPDGDHEHTRIRLLGIDAPESYVANGEPAYFGPEASLFAKNILHRKTVTVYLDTPDNTRGYYGRLLAYVRLPDKTFLNELLITEGYAYADLRFEHSHYNRYKQLDSAARTQQKGLWKQVTRQQLPQWLQKRKPTLLKQR